MGNINRRAYLDAEHTFTVVEEKVPSPKPNEVLVKIIANGICGSDIHFYREGRLGNFIVEQPYVPGHESSGIIEAVGSEVKGFTVGDPVVIEPGIPCGACGYCKSGRYNLCPDVVFLSAPPVNGTFCDYITVRYDMVFHIPTTLPFEEAAMVEPVAVGIHAVNRARFDSGATAVIIGAGRIGLLTAQAFKAAGGGKAICVDFNESRLELAQKLGMDGVALPTDASIEGAADVVFETAGAKAATASTFKYCRPGGCVVQVGWPGGNIVEMNIATFLDKELDYVAVNRYANAFPLAIQWISDGKINVKDLITNRFSLDQIGQAFEYTSKHPDKVVKTVVFNENIG
ncbi:NAD(P)-dependent alcohol dehydrogenase [Paenibacillus sp. TAB 01]|uniref:NAD(P)-dependent alcohol dehydrogenase n=1 Tax=Paenibacillus sp. TAB 01 TaxID=3368988 RepID=UPI003752C880